ncbi:MAG: phosphoribosyltransferase [Thiothrix sp.]|nr:MAG: phosphoribosyltransferase [Thiothrix sp.]
MYNFIILSNEDYLEIDIQGYYHTPYIGFKKTGNPDYLNDLKNTFDNYSEENINKLRSAIDKTYDILKEDLSNFDRALSICIIPRSKAENTYSNNQLLFKKIIQEVIMDLNFKDGSNYIVRHTNTKTTHLAHSTRGALYAGDGDMPYPGITKNTCYISNDVRGKDILLIDDIYTRGVNIDEDAIQALLDHGVNSIIFYAVGKTL